MTLLLAVLLAAADAGVLPEAQPYALDVQVSPEEVTLGEHISVTITAEHDARDVYSLPSFEPAPLAVPQGAPLPRLRRDELKTGRVRTTIELTLADYATIEPRLPDMTLLVSGPEGARQVSLRGRPLKFRSLAEEEGQGAADKAHHGPKPPVPVMVRSWLWAGLLGAAAALVAVVFLVRCWLKRKLLVTKDVTALPESDELALQHLEELRTAAPWKNGEGRSAIFRLSEIVRGYLGDRLKFNALDLTSEEFLEELHHRRLLGLDLAQLTEEVRWEDLIKFAKQEPSEEECLRGISQAESLIRHTRPQRTIPAGRAA
jgi:hypothetical protein